MFVAIKTWWFARVRATGAWLVRHSGPQPVLAVTPGPDPAVLDARVRAAIATGFQMSGLPHASADRDDFDLIATGKFHEVAFHAVDSLGGRLRTVADLRTFLTRATDIA